MWELDRGQPGPGSEGAKDHPTSIFSLGRLGVAKGIPSAIKVMTTRLIKAWHS